MTHLTVMDILFQGGEHTSERTHLLIGLGKHVQHQTQGCLTAYAGQF